MSGGRSRWLSVGLLAILSAGCGLGDYEEKARREQARLERLDKEFKDLGPPLQVPSLKEGEPNYMEVFVRPPRGVQANPYTQNEKPWRVGPAFWFARADGSKVPVLGIAVAFATRENEPVAEKELLAALGGQATEDGEQPTARGLKLRKVRVTGSKGEQFLVYVDAEKRAAIAYQIDPQLQNQATEAVRLSLETLDLGSSALSTRAEYQQRARGERSK